MWAFIVWNVVCSCWLATDDCQKHCSEFQFLRQLPLLWKLHPQMLFEGWLFQPADFCLIFVAQHILEKKHLEAMAKQLDAQKAQESSSDSDWSNSCTSLSKGLSFVDFWHKLDISAFAFVCPLLQVSLALLFCNFLFSLLPPKRSCQLIWTASCKTCL